MFWFVNYIFKTDPRAHALPEKKPNPSRKAILAQIPKASDFPIIPYPSILHNQNTFSLFLPPLLNLL